MNSRANCFRWSACAIALLAVASAAGPQAEFSLERAVSFAQQNDPWLAGSRYRQQASEAESIAAGQLPDPTLSLGLANLPVDGLDFGREPMTQFQVGITQVFPRGDSRALKQQQLAELSVQQVYMRQDRQAKVAVTVAHLWLDTYRYRETIRLIEQDRALFEHLADVAQSNYSSALGGVQQQDVFRAQLELTQLEDRLTLLQQRQETTMAQLGEWLVGAESNAFRIGKQLPELTPVHAVVARTGALTREPLLARLLAHPIIEGLEQQIAAASTGIHLSEQQYKPQWKVNAGYGYRDDDPMGRDRSDFFSVGMTVDLPLFTAKRQDKGVEAAVAKEAAIKTEKALMLRNLRAGFEAALARLQRLDDRQALYENRLLMQVKDQAEASLAAYTSGDGDFAEVVRARIAALNATIDFLNIRIDRLKAVVQLNYFLAPASEIESTGNDR